QFNIIEPPRVPIKPVSPDRLLLATLVLAAGIFGGAALAWAYEQLKPAYYRQHNIEEDFELPVYGGISMFWSPQEIAQRRVGILIFVSLYFVLFAAYAALIMHYGIGDEVADQIRKLTGL
ncbi:MAG: hypothetical protein MI865_13190, partial [Proteobacteria bacterium]|nr:hypothetical protein [Pseudomonadota bacterium]